MIDLLYAHFLKATGISSDTRSIQEGNIFFALKGPNFNANAFADQAIEKGASIAVIDDENYKKDDRYIVVNDTLIALQQLAGHHRKQWNIPVLALTGSNGKTTTKELLKLTLGTTYKVHATQGNLNNHIGVPLTILSKPNDAEIVVLEMGANKIGDIEELCAIGQPTHGLITNIGKAHIGYFGGFEGVIRGKSEMYQYLIQHEGVIFVNTSQEVLRNMTKRMQNPILYPDKGSYFHCELESADPFVTVRTEDDGAFTTQLIGTYNFDNIATALCVAKYFNVPSTTAIEAIKSYTPHNNRSQLIQKSSNTILMDAYNANPTSMSAALETLGLMTGGKIAILGDMFELGDASEEEHRNIGKLTSTLPLDQVIFCGKDMAYAAKENEKSLHFSDRNALIEYLKEQSWSNSTILVKGSRGMALEKIIDYI